jgi:peptidoglycan-associated lipoprotein
MRSSVRLLWLTPLALAACAHQQAAEAPPAPPVVAEAAPPVAAAPEQEKADDTAELQRILSGPIAHFEFDRSQLTDQDRQKLQTLARAMKAHPASRIRIAGNCDELGTTEYNLALGQRRAEVARKYLIDLGVSGARVDTISYGEEHPVATGHDAESHAANRRDDAELLSTR